MLLDEAATTDARKFLKAGVVRATLRGLDVLARRALGKRRVTTHRFFDEVR